MGKGFDLSGAPAAECSTALLFATGSGISPIRSLITSGDLKVRIGEKPERDDRDDGRRRSAIPHVAASALHLFIQSRVVFLHSMARLQCVKAQVTTRHTPIVTRRSYDTIKKAVSNPKPLSFAFSPSY